MNKMVLTNPEASYMSQLLNHRILTQDEEQEALTEKCWLQNELKNNINGYTVAGVRKLGRELKDVIDFLVNHNHKLVWSIASKYTRPNIHFADLFQEGQIGLIKAIQKFDVTKVDREGQPLKLSTYATWWIRQAVSRYSEDNRTPIRIPNHLWHNQINPTYKAEQSLKMRNGEDPTIDELAKETGLPSRKVENALRILHPTLSLDEPVAVANGDSSDVFTDLIEDDTQPKIDELATRNQLAEKLDEILSTLSPREEKILRLRFGCNGDDPLTLEDVGAKFGLTRERIRQIEAEALRKLRHPSRSRLVRDFVFA